MSSRSLRLIFAVMAALVAVAASAQLPQVELSAGMHRIEAELAADDRGRAIGLMNRAQMPPQRGMLFAFPEAAAHCMWMKNTLLPLSVAFLDAEGRIINIEDMRPQTLDSHCARSPAPYALEMNQGWFRQRGIKPGDLIRGVRGIRAVN